MLTLVKNGSSQTLYIDGISQGSETMTNITPVDYIGTGQTGNNDYHFTGKIDDVRIYNRALSSDEITRLYKLGARE